MIDKTLAAFFPFGSAINVPIGRKKQRFIMKWPVPKALWHYYRYEVTLFIN